MTHVEVGSTALWLMLLLGAYHGINPGMGWLFAVALGMQQQKASAVARSLVPIAIGHALAIGVVVLAAALLGRALPLAAIRYLVAAVLDRSGNPSPGAPPPPAMGPHAGRLPRPGRLVLSDGLGPRRRPDGAAGAAGEQHRRRRRTTWQATATHRRRPVRSPGSLATGVHTIGYLAVTGVIAWVVYRKFGLALLRTAWFNLDVVWAAALLITGLVTLVT